MKKNQKTKNTKREKAGIVIPTIREESIKRFIKEWKNSFVSNKILDKTLYLVEDNPEKTFKLRIDSSISYAHFSWKDIKNYLKSNSWIIPRRSDAVRSFGYLMAYKDGCDYIITLDDDCYPLPQKVKDPEYLINQHLQRLKEGTIIKENMWFNTIKKYRPRGIPYSNFETRVKYKNIIINHGLWVNVPDFDAITSFNLEKGEGYFDHLKNCVIPQNKFFPMCGMNLSWKRGNSNDVLSINGSR